MEAEALTTQDLTTHEELTPELASTQAVADTVIADTVIADTVIADTVIADPVIADPATAELEPDLVTDEADVTALKAFEEFGVDEPICAALSAAGITHAFPIQALTLPIALDGHDIIGQARTGTG